MNKFKKNNIVSFPKAINEGEMKHFGIGDEIRKYIMRNQKKGRWFERETYY